MLTIFPTPVRAIIELDIEVRRFGIEVTEVEVEVFTDSLESLTFS